MLLTYEYPIFNKDKLRKCLRLYFIYKLGPGVSLTPHHFDQNQSGYSTGLRSSIDVPT